MLKLLFANTAAKKTSLLAAAFALLCVVVGGQLRAGGPSSTGQAAAPAEPEIGPRFSAAVPVRTLSLSAAGYPLSGEYPTLGEEPVFASSLAGTDAVSPAAEEAPPLTAESFVYTDQIPLSYDLQRYTYQRCLDEKLEYELILALMWRESGFQLDAVGYNQNGTTDSGVMQINDVNKDWLSEEHGITNLMDPYQNIDAGTIILGDFTAKYGAHGALMAYQYGEEGMKRKYAEGVYTNDLIVKLMTKREEIQELVRQA